MGREIERKYLVAGDEWRSVVTKRTDLRQGYLVTDPERNVRVRTKGEKAFLTLKGKADGSDGTLLRREFEYQIPLEDAHEILGSLCLEPLIEKTRHLVEHGGLTWEIDEFRGHNAGLLVAEVELESETQEPALPAWVGREVTDDPRYLNANLVRHPDSEWRDDVA